MVKDSKIETVRSTYDVKKLTYVQIHSSKLQIYYVFPKIYTVLTKRGEIRFQLLEDSFLPHTLVSTITDRCQISDCSFFIFTLINTAYFTSSDFSRFVFLSSTDE